MSAVHHTKTCVHAQWHMLSAPDKLGPVCIVPDFAGDEKVLPALILDEVCNSLTCA